MLSHVWARLSLDNFTLLKQDQKDFLKDTG